VPSRSFQARGVTGPHTIGVVLAVRGGGARDRRCLAGSQQGRDVLTGDTPDGWPPGPARTGRPGNDKDQPVTRSCAAGSSGPLPRGDVLQDCAERRRWFEAGHPGAAIVTPARPGAQWRAILPPGLLPRRPASGIPVQGLACAVRARVPQARPTVPRARAVLPGAPAVTGCRRCMVPGPDAGHPLPGAASRRECTGAPGRVPEPPSTASDRRHQQPANLKLAQAVRLRAPHENTLVMGSSPDDELTRRPDSWQQIRPSPSEPGDGGHGGAG